jgi:TonB family protein
MPYFSDSQEAVSRFGDYIEEFQSVFRSNDVDYGTPDDFFAFARSLNYDAQLRANLSAQAKSVMARENKVPLRTILTIIALASGGPEVANSDRDMSKPVNLLIDFLIKAGGCIQINSGYPSSEHPDSPGLETAAADSPGPALTLDQSSADEGMRAEQAEQIDIAQPAGEEAPGNPPVDRFPQDYAGSPNTLTESLTRLEINSLQLKHYLDSIDQRISRMEPRLDNVPSLAFSNPAPHPRDASDAKFSAEIPSETEPHPPHESTPRPTQPPSEANPRPELISRLWTSSRQFLFSLRPIVLPVILLFAALLLCALFLWSFGRSTSQAIVHPANVTGNDTTNAGSINLPPSAIPTASAPSASTSTPQPTSASQGSTSSHPVGTGNHPSKNSAAIPFSRAHTSSPAPAKEAPPPALAADASNTSDTLGTADTASPALSTRPYKSSSASLSGSLLNVSSGVMAANLLAAPMPTYPRLASLTHMHGNVMMQAIISKEGTVESVHVLKGHRLLRSAATNAVRAWRYRPYLVNGRPVEVATIVSVEFTLEH